MTEEKKVAVDEIKVEPAEISAYMDIEAAEDIITREKWVEYCKARYAQVKNAYENLVLAKKEAEATKNEQWLTQSNAMFNLNYRERKYFVRQLRAMGEQISDRFIIG